MSLLFDVKVKSKKQKLVGMEMLGVDQGLSYLSPVFHTKKNIW